MLRRTRRIIAFSLTLLLLAACGDSGTEPEPPPSMTGTWSGDATTDDGTDFTIQLTVSENDDGALSGGGTASVGTAGSLALSISSGTHAHPDVTMTMGGAGLQDMNFTGEFVGENSVPGTLNGSGFVNTAITFNRQ